MGLPIAFPRHPMRLMASNHAPATPLPIELGDGRTVCLIEPIGRGTLASVHAARMVSPSSIERLVALKAYEPSGTDAYDRSRSVLFEAARRLAWVEHSNVVRVEEMVEWQGQICLVTELVRGMSLGDLTQRFAARGQKLPPDIALFVATEVAEGLAAALLARRPDRVRSAVIHGSLTPREVLLSWRGEVKVSDFGLAGLPASDSSIRSLGSVVRRAVAMSPEVAHGAAPDACSDVFSFGVLLHELLCGPRFPSSIPDSDVIRLTREGYVHSPTFGPRPPAPLEAILSRALEFEPASRYPNASALLPELRRVALGMGVGDSRYFLRSVLEQERWADSADEAL